jgi:hypothetical protein
VSVRAAMRGSCRQNSPGTAKRRGERGRLEHPSPDGRERRDVFPSKYRVPSLRSSPQTKHQRYRSSCRDDRGDRMIVSASKGGLGPVRDCTHLQLAGCCPRSGELAVAPGREIPHRVRRGKAPSSALLILPPESGRSAFGQLRSLRPPQPSPSWVRSRHQGSCARTSLVDL